ncbi:kelch-like protein diablo [Hydra vulgaris]|uniref:kelch-like protein diablo n=1 Tax=Hydra vulgaris TaxID=6087 RepID=UPI001F5F06E1|nr:kelch-like protein diablo [Hydra vulgaris]
MDNNTTKSATAFQSNSTHGIKFSDVAYPNEFLSAFKSMRYHDELCDVHLLVGSTKITAHKAVLAASSPYFHAMFTGSLLESQMKEVVIHNESENEFSQVIDYFYSSKIYISDSNVESLLQIAGLLQLPRLQHACCEVIKRKVTVNNCLGIAAFAESHNCLQLVESAHNYAVNHFIDVIQGDEFMKIDIAHICKLISEDGLNVSSEERIFEVAVAWLRYDYENRKKYAAELFSHVRFPLLSAEFLMERVANEDIVRENRLCCDLLLEATKFLLLPKLKTASACILPRKFAASHHVMYAVGGMSRREAMKTAEKYDPKEGKWKPIGEMSICRFGADIASIGGALYICGGSDDTSRLNTAERYDPYNNVWIPLPEMSSNRNGVGVTMCAGKIYAIGGFNGSTPLNTAECYDTKVGKWSPIASMNQTRFWVGCCTCLASEQIYAIAGSDGNNLRSCERYSVETNTWSSICSISVARKQVTCAALNRYIYAIGGCDNSTRYPIVERYDPALDQWLIIAPLISPRSGAGVGVLDGFLYVCGGNDGEKHLNTIEKYDPLTNQWYVGPPMNFARDCVAVCVASYKKPYQKRSTDMHIRSASPVMFPGHVNTN